MPSYLHPGVYIEEIPSGARPIEAAGTATAAIIGFATKGPVGEPELIFNWSQFVDQFGGIDNRDGQAPDPEVDYMGHTARAFFDNGGGKAYIVRLAPGALNADAKLVIPLNTASSVADIQNYLNIEASSPGTWADGIVVKLKEDDASATPPTFTMSVGRLNAEGDFTADEIFKDVTLVEGDPDFVSGIVNDASQLIRIEPVDFQDLNDTDKQPHYLGTLTSGDLSGLNTSAIQALDGKKLKVTLDIALGAPASNIDIDVTFATPSTLEDLASDIVAAMNTGPSTNAKTDFTCIVDGGRLVLTSGTRLVQSSVTVTAGTPAGDDAAATLLLLAADAVAQTGEEAFLATFSTGSSATLSDGNNGSIPKSTTDYEPVFTAFRKMRDINIIMTPDHQWDPNIAASTGIIDLAIKHAEYMKNRMVLIDPPVGSELRSENDVKALGLKTSTYTALYYPWLEVANPHYHPDKRPDLDATYLVPPSGYAAGNWAKTDSRRGVWKAPAGLATGLVGAAGTEFKVGNDEQDGLNPAGVNCYRAILSSPVIWGSRTLATKADPEWRYVPVRRTAMMIEESIFQGIQWAVFEPNDHNLWASLRLNIETFMDGLHRSGAFQGEKASDAFFVRCGLGDTMTQGDIDAGRVIVVVGFAPLKPAEFVIVRIQQQVAQQ